jgi:hypothetical protein
MTGSQRRLWRVRFELVAWETDLRAATTTARQHAERWRLRIEVTGGISHDELLATRAEDDHVPLPGCVKTRIPDPGSDDPATSPWGAVLRGANDRTGPHLAFLAFGLRHPPEGSSLPSVYQRAHRRLAG